MGSIGYERKPRRQKRNRQFHMLLSAKEPRDLDRLARAYGLSSSDWLRQQIRENMTDMKRPWSIA